MPENNQNSDALKQAVKDTLIEAAQEQREWLRDVFTKVIEDILLARAIREGRQPERTACEKDVANIAELKQLFTSTQQLPQVKRLTDEEIAEEVAAYRSGR